MEQSSESVRSVRRALQMLQLFNSAKSEWGITEMSKELGLSKGAVHRLAITMEEEGFLAQNPDNDKYRLGLKLFELGSRVINVDLRLVLPTWVRKLSQETGETVHVSIIAGLDAMSVEEVDSWQTLRPAIFVGKRAPLYCTAVGKALLAFLPKDEQELVLQSLSLARYTPNTITDPVILERELATIKARGYAVDEEEHEPGIRCVGAPIRGCTGEMVASISISGPAIRITREQLPFLAKKVMETAGDISRDIGYRGDYQDSSAADKG